MLKKKILLVFLGQVQFLAIEICFERVSYSRC